MANKEVKVLFGGIDEKVSKSGTPYSLINLIVKSANSSRFETCSLFLSEELHEQIKSENPVELQEAKQFMFLPNKDGNAVLEMLSFSSSSAKAKSTSVEDFKI